MGRPHLGAISPKDVEYPGLQKCLNYLRLQNSTETFRVKSPDQKIEFINAIRPKTISRNNSDVTQLPSNDVAVQKRMTFDNTAENNNDAAKLKTCDAVAVASREFVKIKPLTSKNLPKNFIEMGKYFDDNIRMRRLHRKQTPDSTKLQSRPSSRYETLSTKSTDTQHAESCSDSTCRCLNGLRRSNSEGNIPKSIGSESQKEHRVSSWLPGCARTLCSTTSTIFISETAKTSSTLGQMVKNASTQRNSSTFKRTSQRFVQKREKSKTDYWL